MDKVEQQMTGYRSRATGEMFENMLSNSCVYYREKGIAIIEKTPEPMRPLKPYGDRRRGQYIACFTKQAQADYKGILCDGRGIIFEAKYTDKEQINEAVVTETQRKNLDDFLGFKAQCFVIVAIGFQNFYRVPWKIFGNMKKIYGRKYMTAEELQPYEIPQKRGTLLILEGVEVDEEHAFGFE